jgi:molybdate transport system substrate-binding protein
MPVPTPITILSTHAVMGVMDELGPRFKRKTGRPLAFSYDPTNLLKRRIEGGELFDVVIMTQQALGEFATLGVVLRDTCTDIGRSGLGMSVRRNARKPNIGTAEKFKRALLAAKSVVRSRDGASGAYFDAMLGRLGIAEAMRGKVVLGPAGRVADLVAKGEADLAIQQISELLPVTGADFVGPFPPELQHYTVFSAGAGARSADPDMAKAFIGALATPAAVALFKAKGLEPITLDVD